jgi:hypothetical protein
LNKLDAKQKAEYERLVRVNPKLRIFLRGWINEPRRQRRPTQMFERIIVMSIASNVEDKLRLLLYRADRA